MIEYDKNTDVKPERYYSFFAGEGSWGDASDIVVIDVTELDGHYADVIDGISDYLIPDFMRWYVENQSHDQRESDYSACAICEGWESGTEDEILAELESQDA